MKKIIAFSLSVLFIIPAFAATGNPETESPKLNLTVGENSGGYLHVKNLVNLKEEVLLVPSKILEGYELTSFVLLTVPKLGEARIFNIPGNKLNAELIETLKVLKSGDRILIDQVKANNNKNESRHVAPAIYTIIDDEYRTSLLVGNSGQISSKKIFLDIKTLALLSETEAIRIGDEHTEAGFSIKGYKLRIINGLADSRASNYTIEGNALPADVLKEMKDLSVASTITISEITLVNKETGETKILEPTTFNVAE